MKIAIACNKFALSGGMERYTVDIVREFLRRGIDVSIFTKKADMNMDLAKQVKIHIFKSFLVPHKLKDLAFSYFLKKSFLKEHFDLTLACSRNNACDMVLCGGTHRGFINAVKNGRTGFYDRIWYKLEQSEFEKAKYVVAHSKFIASEIEKLYGIDKDKIKVFYPPCAQDRFSAVNKEEISYLRKSYGLPENKTLFLFPSSSHVRKGYPLLSKVFSESNDNVELIVAGRPIDKDLKNVRYIGYVNDIENLYRCCDYAILASLYEPFGLVGIESVLCGHACVLADNIGACEVIKEPALKKFSAGSESELKALITSLSQNKIELCDPLNQYLTQDFSVKTHVDNLLSLIK